jgi:predicted O-linked N-acetylglucosamine transferase (SPINDLY family)
MSQLPIPQAYELARQNHLAGRLQEAERIYRQILAARPDIVEVRNDLGVLLEAMGRKDEAMAEYRGIVAAWPDFAEAWNNLGNLLLASSQVAEAIDCFRRALAVRPNFADAASNLAIALRQSGDLQQAVNWFAEAVRLNPQNADRRNLLGGALATVGRIDEAIAQYRQALAIEPEMPAALYNLATSLHESGEIQEAITLYRRALAQRPDFVHARANLATALKAAGEIEQAIAQYRAALFAAPDPIIADNLLLAIHFHADFGANRIKEDHDHWNEQFARPLRGFMRPHANETSPQRTLRVGYVSPDLRMHPVGRFLLPVLANYDHRQFQIVCYSDVRNPDEMTQRLKSHVDAWRETSRLSDPDFTDLVREDQIDILIDLTMHLEYNRMLAFARKPAPVQVTYLAYCSTTGLEAMDYRITDPYLDPSGIDESAYSERTVRLPRTYWCYPPPEPSPDVGPLPANSSDLVQFACLNNYAKVTQETWELWLEVLRAIPNSVLTVFAPHGDHRRRARQRMAGAGLDPQRLQFVGMSSMESYLRLHQRFDIALDPFPYGGGTTTCDALWMGVPVVSMTGKTAVSRAGLSILSNVGLAEMVASDAREYAGIATGLARDKSRLAELRATLRDRMRSSPLMDGPGFARDFEAALRSMWTRWCADRT